MERNFGLDFLRCFAIIGVIADHICNSGPVYLFGNIIPVDLFFSLSGFLITQMIVERFDGICSAPAFWAFMANRWLRTLPLYLLALLCYLAALGWMATEPVSLAAVFLRYATFTQYIPQFHWFVAGQSFFTVSWSLAIEEWFYLLCPLFLLLVGRQSQRFFAGAVFALVSLSAVARLGCSIAWPDLSQVGFYRTSPMMRADAFVWGIGAYWLIRRGVTTAAAKLLAFSGVALAIVNYGALFAMPESLYCHVLLPTTAPLSMALLIPSGLTWGAPAIARAAAAWLSTRTYAIYLFHVFAITVTFSPGHHSVTGFVFFLALTGLGADFLYRYIERPFMRMRPTRALVSHPAVAE
jgi:peptidoglycan/LPS O-acetylase OafA/YrhL